MSDEMRRNSHWLAKTDPKRVFEILEQLRTDMSRRHEYEQALLYASELKARQCLNTANVPTMLYIFYLNFAREVYRLKKRFAGDSLEREVNVLLEKWVARTLDRTVLERIRYEVMTIGAP